MKNFKTFQIALIIIPLIISCSNDDNNNAEALNSIELVQTDTDALLFMLEEEKLARDTYEFLDGQWGINQFANIKKSEQSHMNAIINLLELSNTPYTILPYGEFEDEALQNYYNQFVESGQISLSNALQIGATIEDLDIVDLEEYIDNTTNTSLISVFESLKCGSGNHLRSFVSTIESIGDTYTTQFLTEEAYNQIISGSNEKCNL
ncbi:MAG: DUF2202 domain-containing protein [Flavobacteriaceae bacterium]|nr:DUF2202 domain-containing protein [Flavobacteriaceae bacterium]